MEAIGTKKVVVAGLAAMPNFKHFASVSHSHIVYVTSTCDIPVIPNVASVYSAAASVYSAAESDLCHLMEAISSKKVVVAGLAAMPNFKHTSPASHIPTSCT